MALNESTNNEQCDRSISQSNGANDYDAPTEFEDYNIGRLILDSLSSEPHHIGQIDADSGERTSFSEMRRRSVRCALWLNDLGVGPRDIVAICTNNQPDDYIPVLATFYVGAIYSPWYYGLDLPEARRLMNLLRPRIVFTCESSAETLLRAAREEHVWPKIVVIDRRSRLLSLADILKTTDCNEYEIENFKCTEIKDPKQPAMILLSSGSGGPAKCVERSAGSVLRYFHESWWTAKRSHAVCLWYVSLHWYCGTIYFLEALVNRNTRVLHADYDCDGICRVVDKFKVEILVLPISLVKDLLRHDVFKRYDLSSLQCISVGGSYLSPDIVKEWETALPNIHIDNSYGLTEVGNRCNDPGKRQRTKLGSIGFVKSNVQMKVIEPKTGEQLGPDRIGELCFKSDTAMTGYYNDPEATNKVIDDEGWLHSGDLGYCDEKGEIVFTGRLGEMMHFRDSEISPIEIEESLTTHPAVMEACVVPIPHSTDNQHPMAFVKKVPGAKVTEEELVNFSSKLGELKKLRGGVRFIDEMPRMESGVIHRKNLKEMAKAYAFL